MARPMTTDDLGDPRLYEDEAIREQAARLQIHVQNLTKRVQSNGMASAETDRRITRLYEAMGELSDSYWAIYRNT